MVKLKNPVDQATLNTQNQTPYIDIESKKDEFVENADRIEGKAMVIMDPTANPVKAIGSQNGLSVVLQDSNTPGNKVAVANIAPWGYGIGALQALYDPSFGAVSSRTPSIYKNAQGAALADNTIWTPAAGKKFRLMGGIITVVGTAAAASIVECQLQDGVDGTIILDLAAEVPAALATGETVVIPFNLPGNGFLSAAANNVLNADLTVAMATGAWFINVWGTEE
jgi:hypothetical protein